MTGGGGVTVRKLRISLALALGFLTSALSAGTAVAVPPTVEFLDRTAETNTSCGYDILVTFPVQNQYLRTFFDRDGNVVKLIVTGNLVVTLTNTATSDSLTSNISGPFHLNFVRGTDTSEGRQGGPVDGLPGLSLFAGRVDNIGGGLVGHLEASVCDVLAP
jgi:hypothetical protein